MSVLKTHDVYNDDGNQTGTIEVRDDGRFVWRTLDGRRHGEAARFVTALDALDAFRWEVRTDV